MLVMAGLAAAASFILPPIIFKKSDGLHEQSVCRVELTGEQTSLSTAVFSRLEVENAYYLQPETSNDKDEAISLQIEIQECDTISAPLFRMDEGWARHIDIAVSDSVCKITFLPQLKRAVASGKEGAGEVETFDSLIYPQQASPVARLIVPKGMLRELATFPIEVSLYDFRDASIALDPSTPFKSTNCSFKTLVVP